MLRTRDSHRVRRPPCATTVCDARRLRSRATEPTLTEAPTHFVPATLAYAAYTGVIRPVHLPYSTFLRPKSIFLHFKSIFFAASGPEVLFRGPNVFFCGPKVQPKNTFLYFWAKCVGASVSLTRSFSRTQWGSQSAWVAHSGRTRWTSHTVGVARTQHSGFTRVVHPA